MVSQGPGFHGLTGSRVLWSHRVQGLMGLCAAAPERRRFVQVIDDYAASLPARTR